MHVFELGQYKELNITPEAMFTDADLDIAVTEALNNISYQWAKKNKPAEKGDEVIVSINAQYDGIAVPELFMSNFKYTIGDPKILKEFKNAIGKKAGENFEMDITISPNNPVDRVAGKLIHFLGTIHEVLPFKKVKMSNNIARKIDPTISSVSTLKSKLRQVITANALQSIRKDNLKAVLDGIIAHATYELDQDEVNKVCEMVIETTKQNIISGNSFGKSPNFMFLQDLDAYSYADCKSLAERTILEKLVVDEVIRQEKIYNVPIKPDKLF
ncbi:trigger factor [Desulfitobacterium sp.]|uniref:trigger factor n=1 Tax=Desulfitobacterium sp. TaxID=49981 RepID=UPI002B1F1388|nr:trigger factor [Desulfitobacterium sp.]MEA4901525.1 trigger factor [Desulfitobacterium sp.]